MSRTRAVALVLAAVAGLVAFRTFTWPDPPPAPDCAPGEVRLDARGTARCGPGRPLPAGQALTLGARLELQTATAAELAMIPGISVALGQRLVEARATLGGFESWGQVDQVEGVGPATLERLQSHCRLSPRDAGV